jgi:hypothetical protein
MHHRGEKEGTVKGLKSTVATIIAIGVLVGSSVAVAAQETEPAAPVEFTARATWSGQPGVPVEELHEDGGGTLRGEAWSFTFVETSDPRVDGTLTISVNADTYPGGEVEVWTKALRIQNAGGAWQEVPRFELIVPWRGPDDGANVTSHSVFVGEDGYAGWTLITEGGTGTENGFDFRGYIIEGELPPPPEPIVAE